MFADRVPADRMEQFVKDFSAYRLDEVIGAWKPYVDVLCNAVRRTCRNAGTSSTGDAEAAATTMRYPPGVRMPTCPSRWRGSRSKSRW